jgi:TM2 domain-containing membrane protein YozV
MTPPTEKNMAIAYLLWACGCFGFCGIHRFYLGKPITGILWFFSGGLCFVGQFLDLFLIPGMVQSRNRDFRQFLPQDNGYGPLHLSHQVLEKIDRLDQKLQNTLQTPKAPERSALHRLIEGATQHQGVLSLAQAMLITGLEASEVETLLREAMKKGIVHVGNDPETGSVRYYFDI